MAWNQAVGFTYEERDYRRFMFVRDGVRLKISKRMPGLTGKGFHLRYRERDARHEVSTLEFCGIDYIVRESTFPPSRSMLQNKYSVSVFYSSIDNQDLENSFSEELIRAMELAKKEYDESDEAHRRGEVLAK
ncbi:MAG: hypothetical protein AABX73_02270 [Nanoarchaeota archaeon]